MSTANGLVVASQNLHNQTTLTLRSPLILPAVSVDDELNAADRPVPRFALFPGSAAACWVLPARLSPRPAQRPASRQPSSRTPPRFLLLHCRIAIWGATGFRAAHARASHHAICAAGAGNG